MPSVACALVFIRSLPLRTVTAVVVAGLLTGWPSTVSAQDSAELTVVAAAVYEVRPEAARVEAQFSYAVANEEASTTFAGFFESLPVDAVDVTARSGSRALDVTQFGERDGFMVWFVAFAAPLDPGETASVTVDWELAATGRPGSIITPGAVQIDVYGPGPGNASGPPAVVGLPAGFMPLAPTTTEQDGVQEDRVRFHADSGEAYAVERFGYLNRDQFVERTVEGQPTMTIADWDVDQQWAGAVEERVATVVASLDQWFGPRLEPFEVRRGLPSESHPGVALDGLRPHVIVNDAATVSIDHQLAHAWLADVSVDEPWFIEGLAASFSGSEPIPAQPADIVGPIVAEIGPGGVRAVVDALRAATITYPGVETEAQPLPPDWRTLLDLLEGVGGASDAASALRSSVVDDAGAAAIDRRADARVDYAALEESADPWVLPPLLRRPMAAWEFDTFDQHRGAVREALARRDQLDEWATELELAPLDDVQRLFEEATDDMTAVEALQVERAEALEAFDEAERLVRGDGGLLARVGLAGEDPERDLDRLRQRWAEGDYEAVTSGAHDLASLVEGAAGRGTVLLMVPALVVVAVWFVVRRVVGMRANRGQSPPE